MNYYEILEVNSNSKEEDIKKSYRRLAMKYHPDRNLNNKEAEEKFKKINEAYTTLSIPEKRKIYDLSLTKSSKNNTYNSQSRSNSQSFKDDLDDLFKHFYSNTNNSNHYYENKKQTRKPSVYNGKKKFTLSFWEAIFGTKKKYTYKFKGVQYSYNMSLPAGVSSDSEFNLKFDKHNKNLLISLSIKEDKYIKRFNLDLHAKINLSVGETSFLLNHWKGNFKITIPSGISNGMTIKLAGLGIEKNNVKGDFLLNLNLISKGISAERRKLLMKKGTNISTLNQHIRRNVQKFKLD